MTKSVLLLFCSITLIYARSANQIFVDMCNIQNQYNQHFQKELPQLVTEREILDDIVLNAINSFPKIDKQNNQRPTNDVQYVHRGGNE